METNDVPSRCGVWFIADYTVILRFSTDPVTTVTLNYTRLSVSVHVPKFYWSDTPVYENRPMIVEDLDPAKWMRRTRIINTQNRQRYYNARDRLETFLSLVK